jgi:hypothetical protein
VDAGAVEVVVVLLATGASTPTVVDVDGDPKAVDVDDEVAVVATVLVVTDVVELDEVELDKVDMGTAVVEAVIDVDVDEPISIVSGTVCACA